MFLSYNLHEPTKLNNKQQTHGPFYHKTRRTKRGRSHLTLVDLCRSLHWLQPPYRFISILSLRFTNECKNLQFPHKRNCGRVRNNFSIRMTKKKIISTHMTNQKLNNRINSKIYNYHLYNKKHWNNYQKKLQ